MNNQTTMTRNQLAELTAQRLTKGFLEENDIMGFMSAVLETIGDLGLEDILPSDRNAASDFVYLAAEDVRNLYLA
jgi:hypothetical protein